MPSSKLSPASHLAVGEIIFLNDLSALLEVSAYYVDCTAYNLKLRRDPETICTAQVLEFTPSPSSIHLKLLSDDDRIIELEESRSKAFSVFVPDIIEACQVREGDRILMRGEYNPARWNQKYDWGLIGLSFGFESTVLRKRTKRSGDCKFTVNFADHRKLRFTAESDALFELAYYNPKRTKR